MECPNRYKCVTAPYKLPFRKCINGQRVKFTYFQHGGKALKVRGRIIGIMGSTVLLFNVKIKGIVSDVDKFLNKQYNNLYGGISWYKDYAFKLKHCRFIEKPIICEYRKQKINGSKEDGGNILAGNPLTIRL